MDYFMYMFFISLIINVFSTIHFFKKKQSITLTKDARLLLSELSSGKAIIKVEVIDAAGIYYRSPRG